MVAATVALEGLREKYPTWQIRPPVDGYWTANRLRGLGWDESHAGLLATLQAETLDGLADRLAAQARIEAAEAAR